MTRCLLGVLLSLGVGAGTSLAQNPPLAPWTLTPPGTVTLPMTLPADGTPARPNPDDGPIWILPPSQTAPLLTVSAEYLMWWVSKAPLPVPLVVTGSPTDPVPGALGQPGTKILYGGNGVDYGLLSGMRYDATLWLDPDSRVGLTGNFFQLEGRTATFIAAGNKTGQPFLAEPYTSAITGARTSSSSRRTSPNRPQPPG